MITIIISVTIIAILAKKYIDLQKEEQHLREQVTDLLVENIKLKTLDIKCKRQEARLKQISGEKTSIKKQAGKEIKKDNKKDIKAPSKNVKK